MKEYKIKIFFAKLKVKLSLTAHTSSNNKIDVYIDKCYKKL